MLSREEVAAVLEALKLAEFVDGKVTASGAAASVKHNLQLKRPDKEPLPLDRLIISAISSHELMQAYAMPKTFAAPIFAKYVPGMKYGAHVDSAVFVSDQPLRTDLSMTLFLSDPDSYEGGELVIDSDSGPQSFKLPAGDLIVYPTFALHQVAEVTRGERIVAVSWCQSMVRDPQMRRVLFDLKAVAESLNDEPNSQVAMLMNKSFNNLLRLVVD